MIISRTPLRVSFAGGGSDLEEYYKTGHGAVVSTAINKYIYITVNRKFDDKIRVSYSKTEMVDRVEDIEHNLIREALKYVGIKKGIEVVYMGDIPLGTAGIGLGSSSGLAVGVLNALYAFQGRHVSAERLAQEACELEIDILKHPMGKQDQYISAYGGFNYIQFNADDSVFTDPVIYKRETKQKLNSRLMLFYTGIERRSSGILAEQKQKTPKNLQVIRTMVGLADRLRADLTDNKIDSVGEILHEGWLLKKNLADGISSGEIDQYYDRARQAGAVGGKILGAGAGGFLLLYCREEDQKAVRKALEALKESPFKLEPQGSKIIYVHD
ncbi:MAG: GHMP kinase [Candidatus Omnitrophica bacterium]|nr:GHMP kinase [Candidatus Omnitrophota bacterium]